MLGRIATRAGSALTPTRRWCAHHLDTRAGSRPVTSGTSWRRAHRVLRGGAVWAHPVGSRPFTSVTRRLYNAYGVYDQLLQTHRLATTTATGAVLAFAGDLCTQTATHEDGLSAFDLARGISFACFGAAVTGPVNYVWLGRLDKLVTRLAPSGGCARPLDHGRDAKRSLPWHDGRRPVQRLPASRLPPLAPGAEPLPTSVADGEL